MLNVFKYINVKIFLVSLALGIFMVYITISNDRKIYVYPTPENIEILQYRDKTDTCFQFEQKEVPCPTNEKDISKIPVQS